MIGFNGGLIGRPNLAKPNSQVAGTWSLNEQVNSKRSQNWPARTDLILQQFLSAVEQADGQALESATTLAYTNFINGLFADNLWGSLKSCCILAGARTVAGALVPLVGTAPTNVTTGGFSFNATHYNRKTGLVGDGIRYLNSNRAGKADPQDDVHLAVYISSLPTNGSYPMFIGYGDTQVGTTQMLHVISVSQFSCRNRNGNGENISASTGLYGISRDNARSYVLRRGGINTTFARASEPPPSYTYYVYATNHLGTQNLLSNARLSFYSIGTSIDLAKLDTRLTTLMSDFAAAIP